ncbi:hypothetical protein GE061_013444 [Apolygus lucorum]|uniref:Nucleoside diphosphate kinase-like domain-containing protein n=1 Tax=Apolygus lucorum TaxID=248454 RepID=A0A6A4JQ38_APOLU|nr:hypothetical protein GE061_013444 [Apolygus lucorum]
MICEPKVYFHYDVPQEPSTDEEFDYEPVDFHHKGLMRMQGYDPEPFDALKREEHTLCIIKPSAFREASKIVQAILDEGFTILKRKILHLFPEQVASFYEKHFGRTWFPKAVLRLSNTPLIVMVLAKENAVEDLKTLCGPTKVLMARKHHPFSLRAQYGQRGDLSQNALHASDSVESAKKEILYFFKHANPEPLISVDDKLEFYLGSHYTVLLEGLTELCKEKPMNPALWFHNYLLANQKSEKPLLSMPPWPPKPPSEETNPTIPVECQ